MRDVGNSVLYRSRRFGKPAIAACGQSRPALRRDRVGEFYSWFPLRRAPEPRGQGAALYFELIHGFNQSQTMRKVSNGRPASRRVSPSVSR